MQHLRNAQVAEGLRSQLELLLEQIREQLGADELILGRLSCGERRIVALASKPGSTAQLVTGSTVHAASCPVAQAAASEVPARLARHFKLDLPRGPNGTVVRGVPVTLTNGVLFGVLGGFFPVGCASDDKTIAAGLNDAGQKLGVALNLLYDHDLAAGDLRRLIKVIIRERHFHPVFQPVRDLDRHQIVYREGLTRLDPKYGVTVPMLLSAAHSIGMGPDLELAFAREILAASNASTGRELVAVNLSEPTLQSEAFERFLKDDATPGLIVELTEDAFVRDYPALMKVVARMRAAGVPLAIDDAGAGFTSLRHILELKPDILKIDHAMSAHLGRGPEALALFRALQEYCDDTGTMLVIEGVERDDQIRALRSVGVRFVQGFHVGAPVRHAACS